MREPARGGYEGPDGWVFERSAGRLCLDFANTVDNRPSERARDLLQDERDLVAWAEQSGLVSRPEATKLRRGPAGHRPLLTRARRLRETLFEIFSSLAGGGSPPRSALAHLGRWVRRAYGDPRLELREGGFRLEWATEAEPLDRVLLEVTRSASELLTSPELSRVRVCAAPDCAWLFVDESRNRSRQWCDMAVCGNRAKARRHYRRRRAANPALS